MAAKRNPGERAGLDREKILDAALALVDREGLKALSMRRLAAELGVEAMTLYHYLPSKDALLDGLVERVLTQALPLPEGDAGWRPLLRGYADSLRTALLRTPALLPLLQSRPAVTPATLAAAERGLAALVSAGFPLGRALDAINALTVLVLGHAAAEAGPGPGAGERPEGSAAWLAGLAEEEYPLLVRAARTGYGTDDAERFAFAVDALLTGFAATLDG
ncbi:MULTISPECIES: TetR/AcrR family transcriptional regulator C-terminal domain-containing protein [Streptomyces]|uniref:TetR/AcrR family transcriptional regulator C-terminal domain-containing protein n=1 Tax=Streptomyces TaxID=1883 RepID=UPI00345B733F